MLLRRVVAGPIRVASQRKVGPKSARSEPIGGDADAQQLAVTLDDVVREQKGHVEGETAAAEANGGRVGELVRPDALHLAEHRSRQDLGLVDEVWPRAVAEALREQPRGQAKARPLRRSARKTSASTHLALSILVRQIRILRVDEQVALEPDDRAE